MGPKRPGSSSDGKVVVKTEPLCVKGVSGKALTNKVAAKLTDPEVPAWLRKHYEGKIKWQKSAGSQDKADFIKHLLEDDLADSTYFKRLKKTVHQQEESTQAEWLSWTRVLTMDSKAVIQKSLEQGKMLKRLSKKLNHDEDLSSIPEDERFEYRYVTEGDAERTFTSDETERGREGTPEEVADKVKELLDKVRKKALMVSKKWQQQHDDIKARLDKHSKNG